MNFMGDDVELQYQKASRLLGETSFGMAPRRASLCHVLLRLQLSET